MKKLSYLLVLVVLLLGCVQDINDNSDYEGIPQEAVVFFEKGLDCEEAGNIDEAIIEYERAVSIYATFPEANYKLYIIYKDRGEEEHSQEHYKLYQEGK